ncbi:protein zwilch homolog isoform X2 [Artemia franciscana]|uniref:protein zwilch homolog isoform X2 n=1 Tax=Artemia franciscana TaxID=6661 RepID=UPI0032DA3A34
MAHLCFVDIKDPLIIKDFPLLEYTFKALPKKWSQVGLRQKDKTKLKFEKKSAFISAKPEEDGDKKCPEEYEGNPLECPFDLEALSNPLVDDYEPELVVMLDPQTLYMPLKADDARSVLVKRFLLGKNEPSLFYCDSLDSARILLIGQETRDDSKITFLANYPFSSTVDKNNSRISINCQMQYHLSLSSPSMCKIRAWARYLLHSSKDMEANSENSLIIECDWSNPKITLEHPPIGTEKVKVKATIHPEDPGSAGSRLWSQLKHLGSLIEAFSTGELKWVSTGNKKCPEEQLKSLIGEKTENLLNFQEEERLDQPSGNDIIGFTSDRKNLDIVDSFWNVMLDCSNYEDLKAGLDYVLAAGREGKLCLISSIGKTLLGKALIKSLRGSSNPVFGEVEPLQLLVDCGIEKFKHDYVHAFTSANLANKEEILSALPDSINSDFIEYANESVKVLKRFHLVLEMSSLIMKNLKIPQAKVVNVMDKIFASLKVDDKGFTSVDFDIPMGFLAELLKSGILEPIVWQSIITSENVKKNVTTSWCFTMADSSDSKNNVSGNVTNAINIEYDCIRMTCIQLKTI